MLPPLLRILLDEPALLAAHAAAYTDLIKQESCTFRARMVRRIGYLLMLYGCALLGLLFAGVALMLHAVTGAGDWLLWVVPAVPLVGALVAGWAVWRAPRTDSFPKTRAQLGEDMQMFGLKEAE
ncbi:MAG: phage holin family protein [Thiobacillus sp.]|nr:phage holin family protein [Thiobacillus sp.]